MRRIAIVGALVGAVVVVVRMRRTDLQERMTAHCEAMFEHMPDTFPPKRMMRGIEELRVKTDRILALLEQEEGAGTAWAAEAASDEAVHHAV